MMRSLIILLTLILSNGAAAEGTDWHWIKISSTGDQWSKQEGRALVSVVSSHLTAALHSGDDAGDVEFKIDGQLDKEITKEPNNLIIRLKGTVETISSDVDSVAMNGTYRIIRFSEQDRRSFGVNGREVIIISDGFSTIGLTRLVK